MSVEISHWIDVLEKKASRLSDEYHSKPDDGLAIEREFGRMMMEEIGKLKPKTIVEIGTGHGYSTAWLSLGTVLAGRGKIYTYDKVKRSPLDFEGIPSHQPIELCAEGDAYPKSINFLFHDSQHIFHAIQEDLDNLVPRVSKGGQIWIHDARGQFGMDLKNYFASKNLPFEQINEACGMAIIRC